MGRVITESLNIIVPPLSPVGRRRGALVWISHDDRGAPPVQGWRDACAAADMVWAGPDDCGNRVNVALRSAIVVQTMEELAATVPGLDPTRIYVGGFSGGAKLASLLAMHRPDIFTGGALLVGGAGYYRDVDVPSDQAILTAAFDRPDMLA